MDNENMLMLHYSEKFPMRFRLRDGTGQLTSDRPLRSDLMVKTSETVLDIALL